MKGGKMEIATSIPYEEMKFKVINLILCLINKKHSLDPYWIEFIETFQMIIDDRIPEECLLVQEMLFVIGQYPDFKRDQEMEPFFKSIAQQKADLIEGALKKFPQLGFLLQAMSTEQEDISDSDRFFLWTFLKLFAAGYELVFKKPCPVIKELKTTYPDYYHYLESLREDK